MGSKSKIALFLALLTLGLLVRTDDLRDWNRLPEASLYNGEPLLLTYDGYYYLRLARDLVEGTYESVDKLRGVPTPPARPNPPPLISIIVAALVKLTPLSLLWAGALVPPILGVLLALPVFAWGRHLGGRTMAFVAVLFTLIGNAYVVRSSIARLDTDCLNVFWAFTSAYCFLKFAKDTTMKRYIYFLIGLGVCALYIWWWDTAPFVAATTALLPLIPVLLFYFRPALRECLVFYACLAALLLLLLYSIGLDLPHRFIEAVEIRYSQIVGDTAGDFPRIGISVSELARPSLREFIDTTTSNFLSLVVSAIGILLLAVTLFFI